MAQKASSKKPAKKVTEKKPAARTASAGAANRAGSKKSDAPKKSAAPAKSKQQKAPEPKAAKRPAPPSNGGAKSAAPVKEVKKEKTQPLSKSDLQYYRNLLLEKRREIIGDVGSMESEAFKGGSNLSNMPIHMADVGTDNFEQEFTLGLIESERQTLREIQEALVRIDGGTFGICMGTGKQIPKVRLEAVPWAKYPIDYLRLMDSGKIPQDNGQSSDDDAGDDDED